MMLKSIFLTVLVNCLVSCCCFSTTNSINIIEAGNRNGKVSYYMGSTAKYHHYWVHAKPDNRSVGHEYRIPRQSYHVIGLKPYSTSPSRWVHYVPRSVTHVTERSQQNLSANYNGNTLKINTGYRNTKVKRWKKTIPPQIIKEN